MFKHSVFLFVLILSFSRCDATPQQKQLENKRAILPADILPEDSLNDINMVVYDEDEKKYKRIFYITDDWQCFALAGSNFFVPEHNLTLEQRSKLSKYFKVIAESISK